MAGRVTDSLSNLPENLLEKILMFLPTRDAARTSVLSRNWRYRWTKLPQLIIDPTTFNGLDRLDPLDIDSDIALANYIHQMLMIHEGPITKFSLDLELTDYYPDIHHLLLFLSRNGIEDLSLNMADIGDGINELTSSFFLCRQLKHLCLQNLTIPGRFSFEGFSGLFSVELYEVEVSNKVFESLIKSSTLLKSVIIDLENDNFHPEFDAPSLRKLAIRGQVQAITFKNTPILEKLTLVVKVPDVGTHMSPIFLSPFASSSQGIH